MLHMPVVSLMPATPKLIFFSVSKAVVLKLLIVELVTIGTSKL